MDFDVARDCGNIKLLGDKLYEAYRAAVLASPLSNGAGDTNTVSIAYTPLHGVGANMAGY